MVVMGDEEEDDEEGRVEAREDGVRSSVLFRNFYILLW